LPLGVLTAIGSVVGFIAALGVIRAQQDVTELLDAPPQADESTEVAAYLALRRRVLFLGGALALIVALAVAATGGLRNTIVAMETARATAATAQAERVENLPNKKPHLEDTATAAARATRFGVEAVWTYGLYYSFVLIIVFLPTYLSLIGVGRAIRDRHYAPLLPGSSDFEARTKARAAMDDILQLKQGLGETIKAGGVVLVPVLTSLLSTMLGGVTIEG